MTLEQIISIFFLIIALFGFYVVEKGAKIKSKAINVFVRVMVGVGLLTMGYYEYSDLTDGFRKSFDEVYSINLIEPIVLLLAGLLFIFVITPDYLLKKGRKTKKTFHFDRMDQSSE